MGIYAVSRANAVRSIVLEHYQDADFVLSNLHNRFSMPYDVWTGTASRMRRRRRTEAGSQAPFIEMLSILVKI